MNFREPLPADCPPDAAEQIIEPRIVYRIVRRDPPTHKDFRSQRALNPSATYTGITECQARGLSVFNDIRIARSLLNKGNFRDCAVCQVELTRGAGYIQQTGRRSHFTWWPSADLDILDSCLVVP